MATERNRLNAAGPDVEIVGASAKPVEEDSNASIGKDSRRCWLVCFAAWLAQVVIIGVLHVFGVFLVALIEEFKCSRADAGEETISSTFLFLFLFYFIETSGMILRNEYNLQSPDWQAIFRLTWCPDLVIY